MAIPRFRLQPQATSASPHKPNGSFSSSSVLICPKTLYRRAERTQTARPSFRLRQEVVPLPTLRLVVTDDSPLRISVCKTAQTPLFKRFRRREDQGNSISPPVNCAISKQNTGRIVRKTSTSALFKPISTGLTGSKSSLRQLRRVKTATQPDPWAEFSAWA